MWFFIFIIIRWRRIIPICYFGRFSYSCRRTTNKSFFFRGTCFCTILMNRFEYFILSIFLCFSFFLIIFMRRCSRFTRIFFRISVFRIINFKCIFFRREIISWSIIHVTRNYRISINNCISVFSTIRIILFFRILIIVIIRIAILIVIGISIIMVILIIKILIFLIESIVARNIVSFKIIVTSRFKIINWILRNNIVIFRLD